MIDQTFSRELREKIGTWETRFARWARGRGVINMVDWIRENGAPSSDPTGKLKEAYQAQVKRNIELSAALRKEYSETIEAYPVKL